MVLLLGFSFFLLFLAKNKADDDDDDVVVVVVVEIMDLERSGACIVLGRRTKEWVWLTTPAKKQTTSQPKKDVE